MEIPAYPVGRSAYMYVPPPNARSRIKAKNRFVICHVRGFIEYGPRDVSGLILLVLSRQYSNTAMAAMGRGGGVVDQSALLSTLVFLQ